MSLLRILQGKSSTNSPGRTCQKDKSPSKSRKQGFCQKKISGGNNETATGRKPDEKSSASRLKHRENAQAGGGRLVNVPRVSGRQTGRAGTGWLRGGAEVQTAGTRLAASDLAALKLLNAFSTWRAGWVRTEGPQEKPLKAASNDRQGRFQIIPTGVVGWVDRFLSPVDSSPKAMF